MRYGLTYLGALAAFVASAVRNLPTHSAGLLNLPVRRLGPPPEMLYGAPLPRSRYMPHQGKRECARRLRQIERGQLHPNFVKEA